MTLSANNDNVARVGIGGTKPGSEALTVAGYISAMGSLSAGGPDNNYFASSVGIGTARVHVAYMLMVILTQEVWNSFQELLIQIRLELVHWKIKLTVVTLKYHLWSKL